MSSLTLHDASLLLSMREDEPSLSFDELLVAALHPTSWDSSFALRAVSFLDECAASPSFIQRNFPAEFVKYGFSSLILPPFEEMVAMAKILDYVGVPVSTLAPLVREIQEHPTFDSSDIREYPAFSTKKTYYHDCSFLPFLVGNGFLPLIQRVFHGEEKFPRVSSVAAEYGQLEILQWLRAQIPPCPWSTWTCVSAAKRGHLEMLQWLRAQDPPCPWGEDSCMYAAMNEQLNILKWLRAQDPPCPWDEETCTYAAANGHLEVLQWLRAQNPPCPWDKWVCMAAARSGYLETLQWLRAQDPPCPWDEESCMFAALNGHLETLQWLRAQVPPCPWNKNTCLHYCSKTPEMQTWIQAQP
jgi:hypothetical protein